jgi:hypothetical protein
VTTYGLIQSASASATGTSATITFGTATTPGNTIVIASCGYYGGSVTTIRIGSATESIVRNASSGGYNAEIWSAAVIAASTQLTVNTSAAGVLAWGYEVAGLAPFDQASGNFEESGTSWSSGATAETIPYSHFVVGAGLVVENTGTITPTAGGWTNETAYHDVIGADGFAIGGVSGYQQPSSPGAYTYSGTSAVNSGWAGVTAAYLAPNFIADIQPGWGGYVFEEHSSYTGISATFSIPEEVPYTSDALISVWVGIGNVYQVGIFLASNNLYTGNIYTYPWTWWLSGAGESWDPSTFPTGAGDSLTVSISLSSTTWYMTITNNTREWSYTEPKSVLATNVGAWNLNESARQGTPVWIYPVNTAEVIIEKELVNVSYGSIAFTSITTTPAATENPFPVFTNASDAGIDQYPGPYNLGGSTFTMYWNGYT